MQIEKNLTLTLVLGLAPLLSVGAPDEAHTGINTANPPTEETPSTTVAGQKEEQDYFNLSKHEPSFFALGNPTTKVQFSFKYKILRDLPIYTGYTQQMFWEMLADSRPFRDVNFSPELFYRLSTRGSFLESIDFVPYLHKSNGRDGAASRSYEAAGLRFNGKVEFDTTMLRWNVRLMKKYDIDQQPDIEDYIGPYEVTLSYLQFFRFAVDRAELSLRFYGGGKLGQNLGKGGREVSLSFRVFGLEITPSLYFSYFEGYGESLLRYNEKVRNFRIGILL